MLTCMYMLFVPSNTHVCANCINVQMACCKWSWLQVTGFPVLLSENCSFGRAVDIVGFVFLVSQQQEADVFYLADSKLNFVQLVVYKNNHVRNPLSGLYCLLDSSSCSRRVKQVYVLSYLTKSLKGHCTTFWYG